MSGSPAITSTWFNALVLAADRTPDDAVARFAGVSCKAAAIVGGVPMLLRVLNALAPVPGLSQIVVVVEAPERSGALTTARFAIERGREVLVVPANVDNVNFRGSHALIRDGAALVDHPDQVLASLGIQPRLPYAEPCVASDLQMKILEVLTSDPLQTEFIVERTGLGASEVLSELTILELEGRVIRDVGGYALRP